MITRKNIFYFYLILVALLFAILYSIVPIFGDDFWYKLGDYGIDSALDRFINECHNVYDHWLYDAGRMANIMSPFFLGLFPHWIYGVLTGMIILSILLMMSSVSGPLLNGNVRQYLCVFIFVMMLPWYDSMMSIMFSLNYIWSSFIGMYVLLQFFKGNFKRFQLIITVSLAFIAGWMHEGLAAPMLSAMGIYIVLSYLRGKKDKSRYLIFIATIIGFSILLSAPAVKSRLDAYNAINVSFSAKEAISMMVIPNCLGILYFLTLLYILFFRKGLLEGKRKLVHISMGIFCLVCIIIGIKFYTGQRVVFFSQLFGGTFLLNLLPDLYQKYGTYKYSNYCGNIVKILSAVIVLISLCFSFYEQLQLNKEQEEITQLFLQSEDGTIFYDRTQPKISISLLRTSAKGFQNDFAVKRFSKYYDMSERKELKILPQIIETFEFDNAIKTSQEGIFIYKDLLIGYKDIITDRNILKIKELNGNWVDTRFNSTEFTTKNGEVLSLLNTHYKIINPNGVITDVKFE